MLNVFSARALSILFGTHLNFLLCTLVPCADSFVIPLFCYMPVAPSNINSFKQSFKSHERIQRVFIGAQLVIPHSILLNPSSPLHQF